MRDGEIVCVGKTRLRVIDPEERYLRQMEAGDAGALPALDATSSKDEAHVRSRLPLVAGAIAVMALFLALGLVLALAFSV